LQTSVLRHAQARSAAARSAGSQTSTTGSDTWSSSEGGSDSDDSDSEVSSGGRGHGTRPVHRQQQRTGRGQQVAPAIETSDAAAAAAGHAALAALPPSAAPERHILHPPYSHLVWCHSKIQSNWKLLVASGLCTDIDELQSANGSCSVQVSFVNHSADWDVKDYILQHPVMQQQAAVQPSASTAGSSSGTQSTGLFHATLTHTTDGALRLTKLTIKSIMKSLKCEGSPHAVVLQERVRCCTFSLGGSCTYPLCGPSVS
jgi:hypothetical protein